MLLSQQEVTLQERQVDVKLHNIYSESIRVLCSFLTFLCAITSLLSAIQDYSILDPPNLRRNVVHVNKGY